MVDAGWTDVEIHGIEGPTVSALRYLPDDGEIEDIGVALAARAQLLAQAAGDEVVDAVADLSAHIMGIAQRH